VQIDPIKPKLKPPGTNCLKLKFDILLSTSAFKSDLRRYSKDYYNHTAVDMKQFEKDWVRALEKTRFTNFVEREAVRAAGEDDLPPPKPGSELNEIKIGRCRLTLSNPH